MDFMGVDGVVRVGEVDECPRCGYPKEVWGLHLDGNYLTSKNGRVRLTPQEAAVMKMLMEANGKLVRARAIECGIISNCDNMKSLIAVKMYVLRKVLAGSGWTIRNETGLGFRLVKT